MCIFIAYSLILFILYKVVFLSQCAAVFLSFVLSSGRSEEIGAIRPLFVLVSLCFFQNHKNTIPVESQKNLAHYKFFYACDFFYVMSINPHQTRSQNLPEHNLSLFYCTFRHSTTPEYTQNPSGNFKQFLILEMNRTGYRKTQ